MGYWGKIGGFCFLLKKENVHMTASNRKSDLYIGYTFTVVHKRTDVLTFKFHLNKQLSITKHMQIRIKRWFLLTNNHTALIFWLNWM